MQIETGENHALEEEALVWLKRDREGVLAPSEKNDILLEAGLALRRGREVYNINGVADGTLFEGIYKREYNPQAGQRPTKARRFSRAMDPWFIDSYDAYAANDNWGPGISFPWHASRDKEKAVTSIGESSGAAKAQRKIEWADAKRFEDFYLVSNTAAVQSKATGRSVQQYYPKKNPNVLSVSLTNAKNHQVEVSLHKLVRDTFGYDTIKPRQAEPIKPGPGQIPFRREPAPQPVISEGEHEALSNTEEVNEQAEALLDIEQWVPLVHPEVAPDTYLISTWGGFRNILTDRDVNALAPETDRGNRSPFWSVGLLRVKEEIIPGRNSYLGHKIAHLVLTTFRGEQPEGFGPGFRDGVFSNCKLSNLYWQEGARSQRVRRHIQRGPILPKDIKAASVNTEVSALQDQIAALQAQIDSQQTTEVVAGQSPVFVKEILFGFLRHSDGALILAKTEIPREELQHLSRLGEKSLTLWELMTDD